MKWTIAILTIPERAEKYLRLKGVIERQIGGRDIEVLTASQDWSVGRKRQWCLDNAAGEYICFVDDDDMVASDYVDSIYPLLDGVDYIGFRMQLYIDGAKQAPTYHSLRYDRWFNDYDGYYRNVSHLNPMKIDIARQARFGDTSYGEDREWAANVHPETEHYIDEPMYFYFFSPKESRTYGRWDQS